MLMILLVVQALSCSIPMSGGTEHRAAYDQPAPSQGLFLFDGATLHNVRYDKGGIDISGYVTHRYYGAVFSVKDGSMPAATVFRADNAPIAPPPMPDVRLKAGEGAVVGIVFKPVTGGKMREHKGIFGLHRNIVVTLSSSGRTYSASTDENGLFILSLPEGEYTLTVNDRQEGKIRVERSRTTIKNIRLGLAMVD